MISYHNNYVYNNTIMPWLLSHTSTGNVLHVCLTTARLLMPSFKLIVLKVYILYNYRHTRNMYVQ